MGQLVENHGPTREEIRGTGGKFPLICILKDPLLNNEIYLLDLGQQIN